MTWLWDALAYFFIFFGAGFVVAAMLTEGHMVGKFGKSFCFIFGGLMTTVGIIMLWS